MGGGFLLAVPYAECDIKLAVIFMVVAITLHGFFITGATVAILDMSPNFSSEYTLCNTSLRKYSILKGRCCRLIEIYVR